MRVLAINTGSSALKAALYEMAMDERLLVAARVERIGLPDRAAGPSARSAGGAQGLVREAGLSTVPRRPARPRTKRT